MKQRTELIEHTVNELRDCLFFCSPARKFAFQSTSRKKTGGNENSEIFPRLDHYVKTLQSVWKFRNQKYCLSLSSKTLQ